MSHLSSECRRMLDLVQSIPNNLRDGYRRGSDIDSGWKDTLGELLLCGMGGSAIAGSLLSPLAASAGHRLTVWRDYGLPGWADARTRIILSSYSGNTEEVLAAARQAEQTGCRRVAITTGGVLSGLATDPAAGFPYILLPGGLPPRASIGYGLGALGALLESIGVLPGFGLNMEAAATELTGTGDRAGYFDETMDSDDKSPASLARRIGYRHVVIYTTSAESHQAGVRLKAQLNENAECPASVAHFPELDHNDIVGWNQDPEKAAAYFLLVLVSGDESERMRLRREITLDLLAGQFAEIQEIRAEGTSPLARILSLVQYGDCLSCQLAAVRDVDPFPVERIEELKRRLS